jgi:hypothetical protein
MEKRSLGKELDLMGSSSNQNGIGDISICAWSNFQVNENLDVGL